jgi:hypothetical protein
MSVWQPVFVVSEDILGGSGIQYWQGGAMKCDLIKLIGEAALVPLAAQAGQAIAERPCDSLSFGFAREFGQCLSELFGLPISDVEGHVSSRVDQLLQRNMPHPGSSRDPELGPFIFVHSSKMSSMSNDSQLHTA